MHASKSDRVCTWCDLYLIVVHHQPRDDSSPSDDLNDDYLLGSQVHEVLVTGDAETRRTFILMKV